METQFAKSQDPLWDAWIEAGKAAGVGYTEDYNGEKQEGLGRSQSNIYRGRRHSAATAFLRPAIRRGNVDLRVSTQVSQWYWRKTCCGCGVYPTWAPRGYPSY